MPDLIYKWAKDETKGPKGDNPCDIVTDAHILYADDDEDTLAWLKAMNSHYGWTGEFVSSASAIIDAVNRNNLDVSERPFDLIVADINYFSGQNGSPRLTGITAARQVRKIYQNIPILFISAYLNSMTREEARRVKADSVQKPILDHKALFMRIARLVYWHRKGVHSEYEGQERRRNSINLSGHNRRSTDQQIQVPEVLSTIIKEVRAAKEGKQ